MSGEWAVECDPLNADQQLALILPSRYCQSERKLHYAFENVGINVEMRHNMVLTADTTVFHGEENVKIYPLSGTQTSS